MKIEPKAGMKIGLVADWELVRPVEPGEMQVNGEPYMNLKGTMWFAKMVDADGVATLWPVCTDQLMAGDLRLSNSEPSKEAPKLDKPRCWWCKRDYRIMLMLVSGPSGPKVTHREFCSMHCFWSWVGNQMEEREEGNGIDGQ